MISIVGRVRQTAQFLTAWLHPVEDTVAQQFLTDAEFSLFMQMPRPDRQHHLRVLTDLLRDNHDHPSLLRAALLHDIGKTRFRFSLPERVVVVLAKAFVHDKFMQWGTSQPKGWKRPFVVSLQHPNWSADLVGAVSHDALALELIRRHQTYFTHSPQSEADYLLLLLQSADDRS